MKAWTDEEIRTLWRFHQGDIPATVRAAVDEAKREVFEFLRHVESDGEIREFPEVRESLRQMIDAARDEARREEMYRCAAIARSNCHPDLCAADPGGPEDEWTCQGHRIEAAILARSEVKP